MLCWDESFSTKFSKVGNSLVVQGLGLKIDARDQVQSLVGVLRSCKPRGQFICRTFWFFWAQSGPHPQTLVTQNVLLPPGVWSIFPGEPIGFQEDQRDWTGETPVSQDNQSCCFAQAQETLCFQRQKVPALEPCRET